MVDSAPPTPRGPIFTVSRAVSALLWVAVILAILPTIRWLFIDAQVIGTAAECRASSGACWAFVLEKLPFLVHGFLVSQVGAPQTLFVVLSLVKVALLFALPVWGIRILVPIIVIQILTTTVVVAPGLIGLSELSGRWSGLFLTISLMLDGLPIALALGTLMAVARTSDSPFTRMAVGFFVDACRAIPLVAILFFAAVVFPHFLGQELTPSKLVRGWITFVIFAASYFCEAVRGGLVAVGHGQVDGARSLGLKRWQITLFIRLPQAMTTAWPTITSNLVAFTKDSSLISIIGVTELFGALRFSLSDSEWLGFFLEGYVFVGALYFALCQLVIGWGRLMERRLARFANVT